MSNELKQYKMVKEIVMDTDPNIVEYRTNIEGWVVERQFKTWYGRKYWKHIEAVSGIDDQPWYYKTMDCAVDEAKKHFGWDLYYGYSRHT